MKSAKKFRIDVVLSVTSSIKLSSWSDIYAILNFMTEGEYQLGNNTPKILLSFIVNKCSDYLLLQHSKLSNFDKSSVSICTSQEEWEEWYQQQVATFGEMLEITPLPKEIRDRMNSCLPIL